jgi:hypothetical protein
VSVAALLDLLVGQLTAALPNGTTVGDVTPAELEELPAVTLSAAEITQRLVGIGRLPRGTRTGALSVVIEVDLADPVLDLGSGERLELLSTDRRTLILPNGPLVRADGVDEPPFAAGDLQAADEGGPYEVVNADPAGRQVRPDPAAGTLELGSALPATGTLTVTYHLGQWDVSVARYQGNLDVAITAASSQEVGVLTRRVADALEAPGPAARLSPNSWGAAQVTPLGDSDVMVQRLGYRFDGELEEPLLPSAGGVITRVAVELRIDDTVDAFAVVREGSPA